jgi:hypothetical protein
MATVYPDFYRELGSGDDPPKSSLNKEDYEKVLCPPWLRRLMIRLNPP